MSRVAALAAALIVMSLVAPVAVATAGGAQAGVSAVDASSTVAQTGANNTSDTASQSSNWSAPGPFSIQELKTGGTHDPDAPPSVRTLYGENGETPFGSVAVRYSPVSPLDDSYSFLKPEQTLETDIIQFYSTAFGEATGDYEVVIVYWQQQTHNGTTYAANQSVQRVDLSIEEGYATADVKLRSQFEQAWQATMWIEQGGDRIPGARWRFKHQSNPLTAAPAFNVDSKGDLWRWAGIFVIFPAVAGLLVSGKAAQHFLERTIVGAQRGVEFWGATLAVIVLIATTLATTATAAVLANAPMVAGLVMAAIGFVVMLGINDAEVQRAGFFQRKLGDDAVSPSGDEQASSREVPNQIKNIVERGSTLYAPKKGLRPMLARYWADPAALPKSDIKTVDEGDEDSALAKMYEVEPTSDEVLVHTPAHLTFAPTLTVDVDDDELLDPPEGDGIARLPAAIEASVSNLIAKVNWRFLGIAVIGGGLLYTGAMSIVGSQLVAGGLAVLPGLIEGTKAVDGDLRVEPAPYHYNDVRAMIATERQEYTERQTFEALHTEIQNLNFKATEEAHDIVQTLRQEMSDKLDQMFGTNTPDAGGTTTTDDDDDGPAPWATDGEPQKGVSDD